MRIVSFLVGLLLRQTDGQNQGNFKSVLFMFKGVVVFSNAFFLTYRGPQKLYTAKTTQLLKGVVVVFEMLWIVLRVLFDSSRKFFRQPHP